MKKLYTLPLVFLLGLTMVGTQAQTQTRGRQNSGNRPATTQSRSGASSNSAARPSTGNGAARPSTGNSAARPSGNTASPQRPGTSNNGSTNRPSTPPPSAGQQASPRPGTPNVSNRPSTPPPANNRPSTPPPATNRPSTPPPPAHTTPPRPTSYRPGYSYRPPMPYTPPSYTYYRPTPPPTWRPVYGTPRFGTILGLTLGAVISNSVNSLINSGYAVMGYNNNEIYLNNVNYCNVNWPNATMFYTGGYLKGSLFSSSTMTYDQSRYNYLYNYLTGLYGLPVATQSLSGGGYSCSWWGYDNTYMTLSFYPEYIPGVGTRYFTTIATGN